VASIHLRGKAMGVGANEYVPSVKCAIEISSFVQESLRRGKNRRLVATASGKKKVGFIGFCRS